MLPYKVIDIMRKVAFLYVSFISIKETSLCLLKNNNKRITRTHSDAYLVETKAFVMYRMYDAVKQRA